MESANEGFLRKLKDLLGIRQGQRDLVREMVELIEEGNAEGVINTEEVEMLRSVLDFRRTLVREVMIPRTEISAIEVSSTIPEIIERIIKDGHSRIPIYEGTIDHLVGVVHARDLLPFWERAGNPPNIAEIMRPVFYVPETMSLETLLAELKRRKTHLAVAVDEYGGVSGLVTLENVLEEIVGDIQDEYDDEEERILVRRVAGGLEVDGRCEIELLEEELKSEFDVDGDFGTIGGLVFSIMGRIPKPGESFTLGDYKFTIRSADERRVRSVFVSHHPTKAEIPDNGAK